MSDTYSFRHFSDGALRQALKNALSDERKRTAVVVALIAEFDERKLYLPEGYPSMYAYCVGELRYTEQSAYRRIRAARAARRFPEILPAIADGRLSLTTVVLLAPYLTEERAEGHTKELLQEALNKTKSEVEQVLAERFPQPDLMTWVEENPAPVPFEAPQLSPAIVPVGDAQLSPETVTSSRAKQEFSAQSMAAPRPTARALSMDRVGLQTTISKRAYERLCYAQQLLSHAIPVSDVGEVLERALDVLIERLEKQKFAATSRARGLCATKPSNPRHIPAHVRRAVWERDGGQCTFVSDNGRRCAERSRLEFDHVQEVARGGEGTVDLIRLRCRAHNQFTAEQTFGAEFMRHKRIAAALAQDHAPTAD